MRPLLLAAVQLPVCVEVCVCVWGGGMGGWVGECAFVCTCVPVHIQQGCLHKTFWENVNDLRAGVTSHDIFTASSNFYLCIHWVINLSAAQANISHAHLALQICHFLLRLKQ